MRVLSMKSEMIRLVKGSCLIYTILEYVVSVTLCQGPSMQPTIEGQRDIVILNKLHVTLNKPLHCNDIVVLHSPINPAVSLCKRILYKQADFNRSESRVIPSVADALNTRSEDGRMMKNGCWVEGDNKQNSTDSRHYGMISESLIYAKVSFRIYPFDQFGWIS
mmetsp:Transcript_3521/g.6161  ORF Transcript_3521/g.6161 Transcript_3521/m.6161 type:complete len:163 (-) Transcript_3521:47-535(-)